MRYFKLPKSKEIIEVEENLALLYIRNGFIEVDKKGKSINSESTEEITE